MAQMKVDPGFRNLELYPAGNSTIVVHIYICTVFFIIWDSGRECVCYNMIIGYPIYSCYYVLKRGFSLPWFRTLV
jgi:hypothetical protein